MKHSPLTQAGSPSRAVVEAVAAHEGVDPIDLETPLHRAVDPDALDALVGDAEADDASTPRIEFTYDDYRVRVAGDGTVAVVPAAETASPDLGPDTPASTDRDAADAGPLDAHETADGC